MKSAENPIGSVTVSAIKRLLYTGNLHHLICPFPPPPEMNADSYSNFSSMYDTDRAHRIIYVCQRFYGITNHDYTSRLRKFVIYRQVVAYLLKKFTALTYKQIGFYMGRKDHATAIHSVNAITNLLEYDRETQSSIARIEQML
jgi:hypothetical protein